MIILKNFLVGSIYFIKIYLKKVKLILNELFPNENIDVPDPYYGGEDGFENVYEMLDQACEEIARKLKR